MKREKKFIEWNGERHTVPGWSKITGISTSAIYHRLGRGWPPEMALTVPNREVAARRQQPRGRKLSLCWYCDRPGTGSCSWDRKLQPVEGWTAKERIYHMKHKNDITYHVVECPEFIEGRDVDGTWQRAKLSDEDLRNMLDMLKAGTNMQVIANRFDVTKSAVEYRKKMFIRQGRLEGKKNGLREGV